MIFTNPDVVLDLVKKLRSEAYQTRKLAFEVFENERSNGSLPGLGIGYFTKLICFLSPNLNGYIMDQWVGKSINLLYEENLVKIYNNWVNDKNDSHIYENFCARVDELSNQLDCTGFEAEKRIFSVGRKKGKWRNYLIQNYNNKNHV